MGLSVNAYTEAFDESEYPVAEKWREAYEKNIQRGLEVMSESRVVFMGLLSGGLCLKRIHRTASFFKDWSVVLGANWNKTRLRAIDEHSGFDFVITVDTSTANGWSYDGLAHTFGYYGLWDAVVANPQPGSQYSRGEPLIPHSGGYNGLGVYTMKCMHWSFYYVTDLSHEKFHQRLGENGLGRIYLNPSQIFVR